MSLILVGTGISFDLTLSSIERLRNAQEVYLERYTNQITEEKIEKLEKLINKKVIVLPRDKVESGFLIEKAEKNDVVLLASGDPLTATTHITLILDAKKQHITVEVFHNSSIYTAAPGISGLQIYRFGKTASLVNPRENYKPTSSLEIIRNNLKMNMHTLVLLDTEPIPMTANTALDMLSEFNSAVVLSNVGEKNQKITYGSISELRKTNLGEPPFSMIIPAKLHDVEEESLEFFKIK